MNKKIEELEKALAAAKEEHKREMEIEARKATLEARTFEPKFEKFEVHPEDLCVEGRDASSMRFRCEELGDGWRLPTKWELEQMSLKNCNLEKDSAYLGCIETGTLNLNSQFYVLTTARSLERRVEVFGGGLFINTFNLWVLSETAPDNLCFDIKEVYFRVRPVRTL